MATQAVSAHSLFPNLDLQPVDVRQQVQAEASEGMMATIARIAPVVLGLLAAIAGSVLIGIAPGILIGVGVALAAFLLSQACSCISNCFADRHAHGNDQPATPWYNHVLNWIPASEGSVYYPPAQHTRYIPPLTAQGHVGVGTGHFRQNVHGGAGMFGTPPPSGPYGHAPVGGGHYQAPPIHSAVQTPPPPSAPHGHAPVGRGHHQAPPIHTAVQMPPPSGPVGHAPVGGGHFTPPPGYGGGHLSPPPPTGPIGHTAVGGGHFVSPPPQHPPSGTGGHVGVGSRRPR